MRSIASRSDKTLLNASTNTSASTADASDPASLRPRAVRATHSVRPVDSVNAHGIHAAEPQPYHGFSSGSTRKPSTSLL